MVGSTLFQVHHENARKAARRMEIFFWAGVVLSAVVYAAFGVLCAKIFTTDTKHYWFMVTIVTILPVFTVLYGYFEARQSFKRNNLDENMKKLGATPVKTISLPAERQLVNVVEEMAIAAGVRPPSAYVLRRDISINAFVLADARGHAALAVSQGALQLLNRDELQALVGHEVGHIANEDLILYSHLTAMLHGYFLLSEWRLNDDEQIHSAREAFWRISDTRKARTVFAFFSEIIGWFGFVMLLYGRWMQAKFSREREWMADARSVQFTRHSAALVSTLKKALVQQSNVCEFLDPPREQQHLLFINYYPSRFNFSTHPPLEARIKRYGTAVTERELDDLRFQMQQARSSNPLDSTTEKNRLLFSSQVLFPILTVQRESQNLPKPLPVPDSEHLNSAILAFFIYHSDHTLFELKLNGMIDPRGEVLCERYLHHLSHSHPLQHPALFIHYLEQADHDARNGLAALRHTVQRIIKLDNEFNLYEWSYYALLDTVITPVQVLQDVPQTEIIAAIERFVAWCATLSSNDEETACTEEQTEAANLYHKLYSTALPINPTPYVTPAFTPNEMRHALKDLTRLRSTHSVYRQQFLNTLQHWQNNQPRLTLSVFYVLFVLQWTLDTSRDIK